MQGVYENKKTAADFRDPNRSMLNQIVSNLFSGGGVTVWHGHPTVCTNQEG